MNWDKNLTGVEDVGQAEQETAAGWVGPSVAVSCLVVEDEPRLRHNLARMLEHFGYRSHQAASGVEAIAILETHEVPVVITDIQMPGMDGIALLKVVRERWPNVAMVMGTSVSEVDVAVSCLQMGATDFITKPFQMEDVRARVAQALDKRRLILENRRYQNHLAELVDEQATRIEELFLEGVQTLSHALDAKDPYTRGHSARVRAYAGATGGALGLDEHVIQVMELGAALHDMGKIGVREDVLHKRDRLSDGEYDHLKQHTVIGARILGPLLKTTPEAIEIVRSHHERLDGGGFPDGLSSGQIPLHVRVVSVADSFDAMTTARPYRPGMPSEQAIDELRRCIGTQFDGDVVEAFVNAFPPGTAFPISTPEIVDSLPPDGMVTAGRQSLAYPIVRPL